MRKMLTNLLRAKWQQRALPLIAATLLTGSTAIAQTTVISPTVNNGGFESGTSGWNFVQTSTGVNDNRWEVGSVAGAYAGTNSAYVSSGASGMPYTYLNNVYRTSHMYRDITFPAGETLINMSFYWKGTGETGDWDHMFMSLAPTSVTPVAGTPFDQSTTITGATLLWKQTTTTGTYTLVNLTIPPSLAGNASSSNTMRLIITWKNDNLFGTPPPGSIDNITIATSCGGPTTAGASNLNMTTATLNWNTYAGATGYNVRYKAMADPATVPTWATPTFVSGNGTTSLPVTGLTANTTYEYQVTTVGACLNYSPSATFTTLCAAPATLPLVQGFNGGVMPTCWNQFVTTPSINFTATPAVTVVATGTNPNTSPFEGAGMLKFNSYDNQNGAVRLVSPPLSSVGIASVDVEYRWQVDNSAWLSANDNVQVQYSTDGGGTWINAGTPVGRIGGSGTFWSAQSVTLPAGAGNQPNLLVGFVFTSQYGNHCYADDIRIKKTPTCFVPTALNAVATHTVANLSWTPPVPGVAPSGYEYVLATSSGTPTGSGTPVTSASASPSVIANTTYYLYVRSYCGGTDYSDWAGPYTFTTPCAPSTLNQFEGFNTTGTTIFPSCWSSQVVNAGTSTTPAVTFETATSWPSGYTPAEGTRLVRFNSFSCNTGSQIRLRSLPLITTGIPNVDVEFSWMHDNTNYTTSFDNITVQYSTNNGASWTSVGSGYNRPNGGTGAAWDLKTVQLPAAAGNQPGLQVAFLFTSAWGNDCHMDGVTVLPRKPTVTNGERCGPGDAVCSATSASGVASPTFRWYTAATGGSPIAGQAGATLVGYPITATTDFWVAENIGSTAESRRVKVTCTVNPLPVINVTSTPVICYNGNNATASVAVTSGGTSPFTYSWNTTPVQTTAVITNLVAGTYTATVTDAKTCQASGSVTIVNPPASTIPAIGTQPPSRTICVNTSTTFPVVATGLNISYQWQIRSGATFVDLSNTGVYGGVNTGTLTVTNAPVSLNGAIYRVVVTGTCAPAVTSANCTLTVNQTIPSVTFNSSASIICAGTNVTLTATPVNGGTTPTYSWRRNGNPIGTGNPFSTTALNSGDVITVQMTSNANCPNPATITSTNSVTMTVNPYLTPSVSITANPGVNFCAGEGVTFTATPTGGGTAPVYQWRRNGIPEGPNNATYLVNNLNDGDIITCQMTSNYSCLNSNNPVSNPLVMQVAPVTTPTVSISSNDTTICNGASVTFTAVVTNEGSAPTYTWMKNGIAIPGAANANTYTTTTLVNSDVITVVLNSNKPCVATNNVVSNAIQMIVDPILVPAVSISATPGTTICAGAFVMFNATSVNGGPTPQYQWKVNGQPMASANAYLYSMINLNDGDVVTCDMNSNYHCPAIPTVSSNDLTFSVQSSSPPVVSISVTPDNKFIQGQKVEFNSIMINGGTAPVYQWQKNNVDIPGATSPDYITTTLTDGDKISVNLMSNNSCANPNTATSNSITMQDVTGVQVVSERMKDVRLYPNPNKGEFIVECDANGAITANTAHYEVLNNLGQVIRQGDIEVKGGSFKHNISMNEVSDGTYFVRITVGEEQLMKKFIIHR